MNYNLSKKHLTCDTEGKSLVYIFYENHELSEYFKIGVATHSKTDSSIKSWKKYAESSHPVTIIRRITGLQTGNPRKIRPLAYFLFETQKEARKIERDLHIHFNSCKSKHSKEWFNMSKENISNIISLLQGLSENKIFECQYPECFWIDNEWKNIK